MFERFEGSDDIASLLVEIEVVKASLVETVESFEARGVVAGAIAFCLSIPITRKSLFTFKLGV